jgi:hypothetical protein
LGVTGKSTIDYKAKPHFSFNIVLELSDPSGFHRKEKWLNQGKSRHYPKHFTKPNIQTIFLCQPINPRENSGDNLGTVGRCQDLYKVWIALVSAVMASD